MSSSASGPQDSAGSPQRASKETPAPSDQLHGRELLDSVLRRTAEDGSGATLDAADRDAFEEVARRYRGQPLTLEPVAVELVQAVLSVHFQGFSCPREALRQLSSEVAQTILDDPVAGPRLEAFWGRFGEVQP